MDPFKTPTIEQNERFAGETYIELLQVLPDGPFSKAELKAFPRLKGPAQPQGLLIEDWWQAYREWLGKLTVGQRDWLDGQRANLQR